MGQGAGTQTVAAMSPSVGNSAGSMSNLSYTPTNYGMGNTSGNNYNGYGLTDAFNNYQDNSMGLDQLSSLYADNKGSSSSSDFKKRLQSGLFEAANTQLKDIVPGYNAGTNPQIDTSWQNNTPMLTQQYSYYNPNMQRYNQGRSI